MLAYPLSAPPRRTFNILIYVERLVKQFVETHGEQIIENYHTRGHKKKQKKNARYIVSTKFLQK